jgi:putative ABC transport system permease protein
LHPHRDPRALAAQPAFAAFAHAGVRRAAAVVAPGGVDLQVVGTVERNVDLRRLGRFERAPDVRLRDVADWLDYKRVVPATVRMQTWIAFGVLLVCLVNATGLLVARFLRKSGEIGVRRALGASRRTVFFQCIVESGLTGLAGGLLGLPLAWLGLWLVRQQPVAYAPNVHMDPLMLGAAIAIAVQSTLLAGVWPAWRASGVVPALQVKSL